MLSEFGLWGIVAILLGLVVLGFLAAFLNVGVWFRALISGAHISFLTLIRLKIKKMDSRAIADFYIKARKSGVKITVIQIENHIQAHGNIDVVIDALIAAHNAQIALTPEIAMAIDLAGRNIRDAIKHCITPKVIETMKVTAVAKNGIELTVRAKITLRTNLKRIIGGALEETIIARVCEGIVTTIGNADNHNDLLESPDRISKTVLVNRSISSDTAFDILSIDISEIDVGRNIGAELAIDQAEATKYISQADAEKRRSDALAAEQEMRALTQQMRAKVVEAESMVPYAIADAFQKGNIDVKDYYKLQNVLSDTEMRKAIGGAPTSDSVTPQKKKTRLS
ncbi:MAG: flotillin-like protein FloA [Christensenellaceae bacterium]|nr:flotillin-like protein FloA [Christensenellaceae bacterium]